MVNSNKLWASMLLFVGSFSYGMLPQPDQDAMGLADSYKKSGNVLSALVGRQYTGKMPSEIIKWARGQEKRVNVKRINQLGLILHDDPRNQSALFELKVLNNQAIDSGSMQHKISRIQNRAQRAAYPRIPREGVRRNLLASFEDNI